MFLYLIRKSIAKGYVSRDEFDPVAKKAYEGIIRKAQLNDRGLVDIYDCSSIGIMDDYAMYVRQPKRGEYFRRSNIIILGTLSMEGLYK